MTRAFTPVELPVVSDFKRTAFTLVELLVVVAIVALLLALMTPAMENAVEAAQHTWLPRQ